MIKIEDKKTKIVDAAIKVFAKKGFFGSKVNEIAKQAGVADGTIYLYFKNKDDVLISIFEIKMDQIINELKDILKDIDNPVEKLYALSNFHMGRTESNIELAEVLTVELRQSGKFMREYKQKKFFEYIDIIKDIIKFGIETKVFKQNLKPAILARAIFGAMDELVLHWVMMHEPRFDLKQTGKHLIDFFINGLIVHENK